MCNKSKLQTYIETNYLITTVIFLTLSCNVVILVLYLTLPYKREGLASHKIRFNLPFILEISCTKSGLCHRLSYSSFLFVFIVVWFFVVLLLLRCFPLIIDVFPSVLVCKPDLFSIYDFRTVVYYCCLYLVQDSLRKMTG